MLATQCKENDFFHHTRKQIRLAEHAQGGNRLWMTHHDDAVTPAPINARI